MAMSKIGHCEIVQATVDLYDATALLKTPFTVLLKNSVKLVTNDAGEVVETIIPDPEGLIKAVAQVRVLHNQKLSGEDIRFLRTALEMKSKDFAKLLEVTPEHISRVESGSKVLSAPTERLARIFVFISTLRFTSRKDLGALEIGNLVGGVFDELSIKPCRLADDKLVVCLTRVKNAHDDASSPHGDGGLWDDSAPKAA